MFFFRCLALGTVLALVLPQTVTAASKNELKPLKIDFRYNVSGDDGRNTLRLVADETKSADAFDAVSGASKARSTQKLASVMTVNKNKVLPKGLRALLLFAVSPRRTAIDDAFTVTQDGKQLTIQFVHRGIAYRIQTDGRGVLNPETSFFLAENVAENNAGVFSLVSDYLPGVPKKTGEPGTTELDASGAPAPGTQDGSAPRDKPEDAQDAPPTAVKGADAGGTAVFPAGNTVQPEPLNEEALAAIIAATDVTDMHNLNWENLTLVADIAGAKAPKYYGGRLRTGYKNGVLTIKGTLMPTERPKAGAN